MIAVTVTYKNQNMFKNLSKYFSNNFAYCPGQIAIQVAGRRAANNMKRIIDENRKNPLRTEDKLVNAINWELVSTTGGIQLGVGRISKLIAEAPYWELINDGGTYITKKTHKVPTTYFASDVNQNYIYKNTPFITFAAGSTHTIEGIDYVGKTVREMKKDILKIMKHIGTEEIKQLKDAAIGKRTYVKAWGKNITFGPEGSASGGAK